MELADGEMHPLNEVNDPLKVNITAAQGSSVYAPILHRIHVASGLTIAQGVAGTNLSGGETKDVTSVIEEYKQLVVSRYTYTREYTSYPGEQVLLENRYVDPLIIPHYRIKEEKETEMASKGNNFFNLKTYINQGINTSTLFSQEHGPNSDCPKAVILQGNSGNGKSFVTQKIMLDWAKRQITEEQTKDKIQKQLNFDLVFHLRCAELNGISGDTCLVKLLNCSEEMTPVLQDQQKRVLFLVDGFDELRCSLPERSLPVTVCAMAEPRAILSSLLRGSMLKDAFLLVTTRSTSTEQLGKLLKCPNRFTEIKGFSEKGVEEYFQKFFTDIDLSKQVHEQVKSHEILYTACFSPVMCWLICTVFKQKKNMDTMMTSGFKSTTSIFIDFVFILLEHHCQDLNQSEKLSLLKHLGQLAEEGMRKKEILFKRRFIPDMILNLPGLPFICTFLHRNEIQMEEMFTFMHVIFQEFFAALFYILLDKTEAETKIKQLLSAVSGRFSFVQNLHLFPVIQFLFGISTKNVINFIDEKHEVSQEIGSLLEEWMQKFVKSDMLPFYSTFPLHCLYEVNDENVVKNVMENWEKAKSGIKITLSSSQTVAYQAAAYCLQFCRHIRRLELYGSTVQTLNIMEAVLNKCFEIHITVEHVSDNDVSSLNSLMGKIRYLHCLRINTGCLSDNSVQMIMSNLPKERLVGEVLLPVKSINYNNTEILLNFHKCLGGSGFVSLRVATLMNKEESLCDIFSINRFKKYQIAIQHADSSVKCGLGLVYLSVTSDPVISNNYLKNLLGIACNQNEMPSFSLDKQMNTLFSVLKSMPSLQWVTLCFRSLPETWSAKVIHFLQTCSTLSFFELKVGSDVETLGMIRGEALGHFNRMSILYYGCRHVDTYDNCVWSPRSGYMPDDVHRVLPCITLTMINQATFDHGLWATFFAHYKQLKAMTKFCPEYDQCLDKMLFPMCAIPALKELDLALRFLTVGSASSILDLFFKSATLWKIGVMLPRPKMKRFPMEHTAGGTTRSLDSEIENYDQNLCSELRVWENSKTTYKLSLTCKGFSPKTKALFSSISITVLKGVKKWRRFFQSFYETKGLTQRDPCFDEKTNALLSFLRESPELEEVEFGIHSLSESCASSIIFQCHKNPQIRKICLLLENDEQNEKNCSSLTIKRNSRDMATMKIHMQSNTRDESVIQVKLPCSEISNIDVPSLLHKLRLLNGLTNTSQEYDVQKDELFIFLQSVPHLQFDIRD